MTNEPAVPEKLKTGVLRRDGNQCQLRRVLTCMRVAMDVYRARPFDEVGDDPKHIRAGCAVCVTQRGPGHGVEIRLEGGPSDGHRMVLTDEVEAFTLPHLGGLPGSPKYAHVLHYHRTDAGSGSEDDPRIYAFDRAV